MLSQLKVNNMSILRFLDKKGRFIPAFLGGILH